MIFPIQLMQININKLNNQSIDANISFQIPLQYLRQSGTMIKKYLVSLFQNLKEYPKVVGGVLVVGLFGLAVYGMRIKEINELYHILKQRNFDSCETKLQKMGIKKDCQKILIPLKSQHKLSSSQSLSTNSTINIEESKCELYLEGWHIRSPSKIRKSSRLIIFYHSQHTKIQDNLNYVKNLIEYTVSDVLIADYRFQNKDSKISQYRNQLSMKKDAQAIFNKGLQIALKQKKDIIVLGKDLGAILGIYICSLDRYKKFSSLKGLVIQNPFTSLLQLRISQIQWPIFRKYAFPLYKFILSDKWQSKQEIRKIKVPTMLLIKEICQTSEALMLYSQYPGRKILHQIMQKEKDNRKIENLTDYFMDIDIFLNNSS